MDVEKKNLSRVTLKIYCNSKVIRAGPMCSIITIAMNPYLSTTLSRICDKNLRKRISGESSGFCRALPYIPAIAANCFGKYDLK